MPCRMSVFSRWKSEMSPHEKAAYKSYYVFSRCDHAKLQQIYGEEICLSVCRIFVWRGRKVATTKTRQMLMCRFFSPKTRSYDKKLTSVDSSCSRAKIHQIHIIYLNTFDRHIADNFKSLTCCVQIRLHFTTLKRI